MATHVFDVVVDVVKMMSLLVLLKGKN